MRRSASSSAGLAGLLTLTVVVMMFLIATAIFMPFIAELQVRLEPLLALIR